MGTTTGTNNLPIPVQSDTPDVCRDMQALADAVDPLLGGAYICTSTSHPSGVPAGRMIWESDTKTLLFFDGTTFYPIGNSAVVYTSGVLSPQANFSLGTYSILKYGAIVFMTGVFNNVSAGTLGPGDIGNTPVATLTLSSLLPSTNYANELPLYSAATGNTLSGSLNTSGILKLCACQGAISNGTAFNLCGVWTTV